MATNRTPTTIRGLLVPDHKLKYAQFSTSLSTLTQAGPLPGVPEPAADTDLVLEATGSQSAGRTLRLQALKAGMPAPDEGGFVWRYPSDTDRRGWEPPQTISFWKAIDSTTTSGQWRNPHAVRTSNQTVVCAVQKSTTQVAVWWRNPTTYAWTEVSVYTHGTYTYRARPTLVLLPSGRILLFFWVEDSTLNQNQIRCHVSDDNGATWSLMNKACLRTPLTVGGTVTPGRLRAAYANNQILMLATIQDTSKTRHDLIVQYASNDQGGNFSLVSTWTGADWEHAGNYQEIVVHGGQFLVAYLRRQTSPSPAAAIVIPFLRRITNAFEAVATAQEAEMVTTGASGNPMTWGTITGNAFSAGDLAFWRDDDGVVYIIGRNHTAGSFDIHVSRSTDGGDTWEAMGDSAEAGDGAVVFSDGEGTRYPQDFCCVPVQGRAMLIHRFTASVSSYGASLCAALLGGYTTVNLPALYNYPIASQRVGWSWTWLPFDEPDDVAGVTPNVIGAAVSTLTSSGVHRITSGAGDAKFYQVTPPATSMTEGLLVFAQFRKVSGADMAYFKVRLGGAGPHDYIVRVEITSTAITLYDINASAVIDTVATTAGTTEGLQVLLGLNNPTTGTPADDGVVAAWFRVAGADPDREWTALGDSSTLVDGAAETTSEIEWGCSGAAVAEWTQLSFSSDSYTGKQLTAFNNPTDLLPRNFSPEPVYVDDGVKIAARRGPCTMNEVQDINTRYEHGIERAHPDVSPSPSDPWRSTDTTQHDLVWEYDGTLDEEVPPLSPTVGLYLGSINFRTGSFWGYDKDTTAYVKLCDIDAATGQAALRFTRQGRRVIVDTAAANSATDYFTRNILAGSHFSMGGIPAVVRKIATNTGGAWTDTLTKRPVVDLDGVEGGDPGSGTTGAIWSKDVTILVNNATKYTRYRLRIDAQDTAEGYFYAGVIVLGYLVPFARQYSWGRGQAWTPNTEIETHPSGARTVTARGPLRRTATLPWVDGIVTTQLGVSSPTPDYILPYTGATTAIGAPAETPYDIAGLVEHLEGAKTPVVYLPTVPVPANSTTVTTIVNRNKMLYGRIVGPVTTTSLMGNEWSSTRGELLTVEAVTIEEEV